MRIRLSFHVLDLQEVRLVIQNDQKVFGFFIFFYLKMV